MSEETTLTTTEETTTVVETTAQFPNPFDEEGWVDVPVNVEETATTTEQEHQPETATTTETKPVVEETKAVIPDYLKDFGWETPEAAKEEITTLRKLKETAPKEFTNEESKRVYELLLDGKIDEVTEVFSNKKKITNLLSGEIDDKTASEIIKMKMQLEYKDLNLSPKEIEYKYNQQFKLPKEPIQALNETDEEFEERQGEWKEQVSNIEMGKIIEAKLARPVLEKLNAEIVLPNITQKSEATKEPTPEEVEAANKVANAFKEQSKKAVSEFEGFTAIIKNEDVEIPIAYSLSEEEKLQVNTQLNKFAESGFNANALFAERWLNKDNTLDVLQMTKDLAAINNEGRMSQKFVNDAASKMLLHQKQVKSNIKVTGQNKTFEPGVKTQQTEMADTIWSA